MSRATVSGDKVSLSGDESFRDLVLPLVKSLRHALEIFKPVSGTPRPKMLLCVAVLDAPMLLVEDPLRPEDPVLCPWVRVVRREPNPNKDSRIRSRFYAIDVVHAGFLSSFVADHVLPFGEVFAERIRARPWLLAKGGIVEDLGNWSWDQISKG
jgi:hypothetical protein